MPEWNACSNCIQTGNRQAPFKQTRIGYEQPLGLMSGLKSTYCVYNHRDSIEDWRFLDKHKLRDNRQSAYRSFHSTETASLIVHHDITTALDNNSCSILIMLDLSAALDVIGHKILYR